MPNHYLSKCCVIVNWTLGNKFQCNFNQNTTFFIHENIIEKKRPFCSGGDELKSGKGSHNLFLAILDICALLNWLCPSNVIWHHYYWLSIWLAAYKVPSHYLNQCWLIVKWMLRNFIVILIKLVDFHLRNCIWERCSHMVTILFRPECVNCSQQVTYAAVREGGGNASDTCIVWPGFKLVSHQTSEGFYPTPFSRPNCGIYLNPLGAWTKWPTFCRRHFEMQFF